MRSTSLRLIYYDSGIYLATRVIRPSTHGLPEAVPTMIRLTSLYMRNPFALEHRVKVQRAMLREVHAADRQLFS